MWNGDSKIRVGNKDNEKRKNRAWQFSIIAFSAIVVLVVLYALSVRKSGYTIRREFLLDTYVSIAVNGKGSSVNRLIDTGFSEIKRIDEKFNPSNNNSILYKINHADGRWVKIDSETHDLLERSLYYSNISNDTFDITLGKLIKIWGFYSLDSTPISIPSKEEIFQCRSLYGSDKIELEANKIRLKTNCALDLGGIAKGYAVDMAILHMKEKSPDITGYVDAGGDIRIIGKKYGSLPWSVGIRDPRSEDKSVDVVYLKEGSIATSGDYERYFTYKGKRYCHIFDPKTGFPARKAISATVISKNLVDADALATTVFVLGPIKGLQLLNQLGVDGMIIDKNKKIYKTRGFEYYEKRR